MTTIPMIAIVDDDAEVRHALGRLLRSFDYGAALFASGQALLDSGMLDRIDCVVTDIQMPGMSGFALHDGLRRRGLKVPVIFVTAFPQPGQESREAGTCLLYKPFLDTDMLACIRAALAGGH